MADLTISHHSSCSRQVSAVTGDSIWCVSRDRSGCEFVPSIDLHSQCLSKTIELTAQRLISCTSAGHQLTVFGLCRSGSSNDAEHVPVVSAEFEACGHS